jgi:hypothetical protein
MRQPACAHDGNMRVGTKVLDSSMLWEPPLPLLPLLPPPPLLLQ